MHGGVWHERTELQIVNPHAGSAAFRVARSEAPTSVTISAYTIDDICVMAGVEAPFIVKIDIACISQYPCDYLIDGETIFCFRDFQNGCGGGPRGHVGS